MKTIKYIALLLLSVISVGCCIESRCWKVDEEIKGHCLPASGTYHYYTNGLKKTVWHYDYYSKTNKPYLVADSVYKYCSNANGPWAGSDIYPATRSVINHLSFMSWSSAASGDYMINIINLPCYPIIVVELPIQMVLDTILLPWDLISAPTTPAGYRKVY